MAPAPRRGLASPSEAIQEREASLRAAVRLPAWTTDRPALHRTARRPPLSSVETLGQGQFPPESQCKADRVNQPRETPLRAARCLPFHSGPATRRDPARRLTSMADRPPSAVETPGPWLPARLPPEPQWKTPGVKQARETPVTYPPNSPFHSARLLCPASMADRPPSALTGWPPLVSVETPGPWL